MSTRVDLDFEPIQNVPAYQSIATLITDRILRGEWPVGHSLPSETILAETLGVNRSTMREAIRVLEGDGMLRRRPGGKRLFVSAPGYAEVAARMKAAIVLQEISFLELWEGMHCIEPAIAAAAALKITNAELDLLEANVDRTRHTEPNSKDIAKLDLEFHTIIAGASRSRALQLCRVPIGELFYPAFLQLFTRLNVGDRLIFAHEKILEGLRTHDTELAREWMLKHIVDFRRGYELANLDISKPVVWPADI